MICVAAPPLFGSEKPAMPIVIIGQNLGPLLASPPLKGAFTPEAFVFSSILVMYAKG